MILVAGNGIAGGLDIFQQKVHSWWISGMKMLPNLLLAVIFWILFFLLARLVRRLTYRLAYKISKSKAIGGLFAGLMYTVVIAAGIYIGLNILKLDKIAISLLAGAGIVGLTLAFAFQDITSNFISGVYIDFNKPFDIGDMIKSNDITGKVEEIGLRSTTIRTPEGLCLLVPNKNIFQNPITNYSRTEKRQIIINFSIPVQHSPEQAEKAILAAVRDIDMVDDTREINFYFTDFDQANLKAAVSFWIRSYHPSAVARARHAAVLAILQTLEDLKH